jgi:hypothetical protein
MNEKSGAYGSCGVFAFGMARIFLIVGFVSLATALQTRAQGTLVFDQQSATTPERINYDSFDLYKQLWEAFVPTLSTIGFVQLEISDYLDTNTSGAAISVALYSGSPQYPTFLGGTERVYLPPNFNNDQTGNSGVTNFNFATSIALTPGQTYYLVPLEITGDHVWSVAVTDNTYPNGGLYGFDGTDLWFREGIVIPEPSVLALWALGGLLIVRFGEAMPHSFKTTITTI